MLQDLDARQTAANEASHLYTKPVARLESAPSRALLIGAVVGVVALAVAGALGWRYWQHVRELRNAPQPVKVVQLAPAAAPVPVAPAPAKPPAPQAPVQSAEPAPPAPAQTVAEPASPAPAQAAELAPDTPVSGEPAVTPAAPVTKKRVSKPEAKASATHRAGRKGKDQRQAAFALAPDEKTPGKNVARKKKDRAPTPRSHPAATDAAAPSAQVAGPGKQENASQKAEAAYRRALASVQEGYLNEAIGLLEQALQANARHEAARQTLIGLLIENKRSDEAMRQLQLGLTLDPKQPAMAMLLARLQIEHGGSGIETLTRTLPYAGSNGEYHAFLAGALQRQQRHREAAEQYQTALQGAPQNGVWCMGLGISLQAEKRDAEALDAFRKAKASGMLAPQLLSFVDSKIKQLSR